MKTCNYVKNSFGLYLFEKKNFLNIANKTSLKTAIFSLFIVNILFSIIGNFIFQNKLFNSFVETLLSIIITSTIGFIILLFLFFIFSGFIHLIYKLFKSNAKFTKLITIVISVNLIFGILYFIFGGILIYLITHPNISFHKILFSLFSLFNVALVIWHFIVSFNYYGRIERVSNLKSLFAYFIIFIIISSIILYYKLGPITIYLKSIYGF